MAEAIAGRIDALRRAIRSNNRLKQGKHDDEPDVFGCGGRSEREEGPRQNEPHWIPRARGEAISVEGQECKETRKKVHHAAQIRDGFSMHGVRHE